MSNLTPSELDELTARINARFEEFSVGDLAVFEPVTRGVVRLVLSVIEEWQQPPLSTITPNPPAPPLKVIGVGDDPHAYIQPAPKYIKPSVMEVATTNGTNGNGHAKELSSQAQPLPTTTLTASAKATLGPEHVVVNPLRDEPALSRRGNVLPTREELIAELKRQSMAGVMPTLAAFDEARPANWATAGAHMKRFNMTWEELAHEAGLKPNPRRGPAPA